MALLCSTHQSSLSCPFRLLCMVRILYLGLISWHGLSSTGNCLVRFQMSSNCVHSMVTKIVPSIHYSASKELFPYIKSTAFFQLQLIRRVWRYQRGHQNPYIEEEQITQWPKEKVQKDKQRSTKHTHKTKGRVTRAPLKTGGELRCSGRVSSSCSTSGPRGVNLVTNPLISHEWGKDREVFTTTETYPWSFVTQIFHNGQPSHGGDRKTFEVMTST
jgi:hypothetical protein